MVLWGEVAYVVGEVAGVSLWLGVGGDGGGVFYVEGVGWGEHLFDAFAAEVAAWFYPSDIGVLKQFIEIWTDLAILIPDLIELLL